MGRCREIWGDIGRYREIWGDMGRYRRLLSDGADQVGHHISPIAPLHLHISRYISLYLSDGADQVGYQKALGGPIEDDHLVRVRVRVRARARARVRVRRRLRLRLRLRLRVRATVANPDPIPNPNQVLICEVNNAASRRWVRAGRSAPPLSGAGGAPGATDGR